MKKRNGKNAALLVMCVLMVTLCVAAVASTTYYVSSNKRLNVRDGAGTDNDVIGQLSRGTKVEVITKQKGWAKIQFEDGVGWVAANCLTRHYPGDEDRSPTARDHEDFYTTTYKAIANPSNVFVNMRSGPSKSSPIVNTYYYGYPLKVVAENGGWCQVEDESTGATGYIMKALLQRVDDLGNG
jgi:uncharacterized protein YgiM (DUF1202 family)